MFSDRWPGQLVCENFKLSTLAMNRFCTKIISFNKYANHEEFSFNRFGPDIQCEPRSCGQTPDPVHGWHAGECYTFGCRITYHCGEGYELVGKSERFCQATGDWSPKELPTCVRK